MSSDEGLQEDLVAGEALEPVRRGEARFAAEETTRGGLADRRGLHEAVAREPARGIHAVADPADDRVRVGRHVVEAGPGACDAGAGGGRIAVRHALQPIRDERLVDLGAVRPSAASARTSPSRPPSTRRKWKPVTASTTIEQGLGQLLDPARVGELPDERPDREVDLVS